MFITIGGVIPKTSILHVHPFIQKSDWNIPWLQKQCKLYCIAGANVFSCMECLCNLRSNILYRFLQIPSETLSVKDPLKPQDSPKWDQTEFHFECSTVTKLILLKHRPDILQKSIHSQILNFNIKDVQMFHCWKTSLLLSN